MSKLLTLLLITGILTPSVTYGLTGHSSATTFQDQNVGAAAIPTNTATLVSVNVVAKGRANTMVTGGTLQFIAYGTYSNGSVVELPESETNPVISWNTSNRAVAKISRMGHATAIDAGSVDIEATVGAIKASPWAVTVTASSDPSPSISCSSSPSITTPGGRSTITAVASSKQRLPLSFRYSTSAGSISGTGANGTLQTPARFGGLITVTCTADQQGGSSASASTSVLVATSSGNLDGALNWEAVHDSATPGESRGSSVYPATIPPYDNARKFYMTYSQHGGERFSISFGRSTNATHFVYDTYVYFVDPSQVHNLEMDINQVMADGQTIIFGTQCSGNSGTWEYTTDVTVDGKRKPHWNASNIPCNPVKWTANCWHHVQIASSRDNSGNVTYDWVNLDGTTSTFADATGRSALSLGWAVGDLSLNFQLDGSSTSSESITAYVKNLTIYRW